MIDILLKAMSSSSESQPVESPEILAVKPASEFTDKDRVELLVLWYIFAMEDAREGYDPYRKSVFDYLDDDLPW